MPRELAVMTFNVRTSRGRDGRHRWWFRRGATVAAIRGPRPDLVGLQEVRPGQLRYLRHKLPEYEFVGLGREGGSRGEHCPVLYRRERLRLERFDVRWYSDVPEVAASRGWGNRSPRIATLAWLTDDAEGWRVGMACTHLDHASVDSRQRSADALVAWLAAEVAVPWLVVGDFNATPDSPVLKTLLAAGLRDCLGHLPAAGEGAATHHGFRGSTNGTRIDHVLVPHDWPVLDARIVTERPRGRLPSDHWPVVARVAPPAASA